MAVLAQYNVILIEMGYMETYNDEKNLISLLLCLILPKSSWTKKITFGNKYHRVMKGKLNFLDLMM